MLVTPSQPALTVQPDDAPVAVLPATSGPQDAREVAGANNGEVHHVPAVNSTEAEELINGTAEDYYASNSSDTNPVPSTKVNAETLSDVSKAQVENVSVAVPTVSSVSPAVTKPSPTSATALSTKPTLSAALPDTLPPNVTAINVELGKLTIHPVPPVVDEFDSLELFCSIGYHDSASIVWTLNDQPLEDIVTRSHISGRKDFFVKSLRIQVDHLETLPAMDSKYVFECVASVDGNLVKDKVEIPSPYKTLCSNDSDCQFRNALCREGHCRCDDLHPVPLNSTHLTCRPVARLAWPCSYSEQCMFGDSHSECGSKGECSCIEGYKAEQVSNATTICVSKKGVNTPCKADADCNEVGAVCAASSTCQCPAGSLETKGRCIQQSGTALLPGPSVRPSVNQTAAGQATARVAVKKILPVRILKVREFPRQTTEPERNATNLTHSLDGLVRLDANDSSVFLAKQRTLTSGSSRIGRSSVLATFCVSWWLSQF